MRFAENLRELRIDIGLSQYQLANKLQLSQSSIAKWELSKTEPTATAIIKIAQFFNISTDELLGYNSDFDTHIKKNKFEIENEGTILYANGKTKFKYKDN